MTSFFDEINKNRIKSTLLMLVFFAFFTGIIYFFIWYFVGSTYIGLAIVAVMVALYAAFVYFGGDKLVLKMSGAKPADEKQYHYLYEEVNGLALAAQVPTPKIYIIDSPNPNAFATGRNKKHASIAVTSGLLQTMDKRELQGVLAHEMSHVYDNDIKFMLIAVVFAGVIGLIAAFARSIFFFGGVGNNRNNGGILVLVALILGLLAPLFALLLRLAISRKREYMADANGARMIRDPEALANALTQIKNYTKQPQAQPVAKANEMTASMYFSNPLNAKAAVVNLFSTHPPIDERIKRLKQMY